MEALDFSVKKNPLYRPFSVPPEQQNFAETQGSLARIPQMMGFNPYNLKQNPVINFNIQMQALASSSQSLDCSTYNNMPYHGNIQNNNNNVEVDSSTGSCSSTSSSVASNSRKRPFNELSSLMLGGEPTNKRSRPFKAISPVLSMVANQSAEEYAEFRGRIMEQVQAQRRNDTNENMRRPMHIANPEKSADPTYLEKRRKNNEAAKKSREARKMKEDEIAVRCAFLEQENIRLKILLSSVKRQKKMLLEYKQ